MSNSSRKYVLEGACMMCSLGTTNGKIKVTSQTKVFIQGKLKVTDEDKTVMPNFGLCKRSSNQPACTPALQKWKETSKKVVMGRMKFVMDNSTIQCSNGGTIIISDDLQRASAAAADPKKVSQLSDSMPMVPYQSGNNKGAA